MILFPWSPVHFPRYRIPGLCSWQRKTKKRRPLPVRIRRRSWWQRNDGAQVIESAVSSKPRSQWRWNQMLHPLEMLALHYLGSTFSFYNKHDRYFCQLGRRIPPELSRGQCVAGMTKGFPSTNVESERHSFAFLL